MLHLRMTLPPDVARRALDVLADDPRVTNLIVLPGAGRRPTGDAVFCDVAREAASEIIDTLQEVGVSEHGAVAVQVIDTPLSRRAEAAEHAAPGAPDDGVVWPVVEQQAWDGVRSTWSFYTFLTLATVLAAIAVVLDSTVLVVGAMVLGPEFAPVASVAVGVLLRRRRMVVSALRLLLLGFLVAVTITLVLGLLARATGWVDLVDVEAPRPQTGFIWHPDRWSFVVALLAGAAGVLSMTSGRSNVLVGVFISVTTVPAAGNLALGLAFTSGSEVTGSLAQLGVNLAGLFAAGLLTLVVQRHVWAAVVRRGQRRLERRRLHAPG